MESVLFQRHTKKPKASYESAPKDLLAILPPSQLLADERRQDLLQKITDHSGFDAARFESRCLNLIHHLVNHCQALPETSTRYYAHPGGFLDHALNRTEAALALFRQFVTTDEGGELSNEQQLWLYALFSAGLLQGIGRLCLDYRVELFNAHKVLIKDWNPLLESLRSAGNYYHFEFEKLENDAFRRRLNLLLARQLMPEAGFAWIASHAEVLAIWLALLNEDAQAAGTLGAILIRADAIAIQRYLFENIGPDAGHRGTGRPNRLSTFIDAAAGSLVDKERAMGVEFVKWLMQKLASGQIMINKAPLLMVPGGLIMSPDMFKWFVREHPDYKNWQAAQTAFLTLGLHKVGPDGSVLTRFEQANLMQSGVVFSEYAVALPDEVHLHHAGESVRLSALELIHRALFNADSMSSAPPSALSHLSLSGEWQLVKDTVLGSPFTLPRGK